MVTSKGNANVAPKAYLGSGPTMPLQGPIKPEVAFPDLLMVMESLATPEESFVINTDMQDKEVACVLDGTYMVAKKSKNITFVVCSHLLRELLQQITSRLWCAFTGGSYSNSGQCGVLVAPAFQVSMSGHAWQTTQGSKPSDAQKSVHVFQAGARYNIVHAQTRYIHITCFQTVSPQFIRVQFGL